MGVLSLDAYVQKRFPKAVQMYKNGEKLQQKFICVALDANPFAYMACAKAFKMGDYASAIPEENSLSYEEKIILSYEYTWQEIETVVNMIDTEELFIAFDGVVGKAKGAEQRKRRYIRVAPVEGEFDLSNLSCGTQYMYELCLFIQFRIQQVNGWGKKKIIFSNTNVPGEGEAKAIRYLRNFPPKTPVAIYGPDGDLIILGLGSAQDMYVFKADYKTMNTTERMFYTIHMRPIKEEINSWSKSRQLQRPSGFVDNIKAFILLANILGNDFNRRIECFEVFIEGIDNLLKYYNRLHYPLISEGRLDKRCLANLFRLLANDEAHLLAQRCQKYPYPLLQRNMTGNRLDFPNFRKEYYAEFVGITSEQDIRKMAVAYLDTIWWTFQYYLSPRGIPSWEHYYPYHYPPFCADLAACMETWTFPKWDDTEPRRPFEQLVSVLPPNRKSLLPEAYHHYFEGPLFPKLDTIVKNSQGKNEKYETIYEIPFFDKEIDIKDDCKRNRVGTDRIFIHTPDLFTVKTKWGSCMTFLDG